MSTDKNICENCANEFDGEAQKCDECGMDGLGNCCIGVADHLCEDGDDDD